MWFLISYNRAEQCGRVVKSMIDCGISTPGRLIVNGTDQESAYRSIKLPDKWEIDVLPINIGVCGAMAKCFREYPTEDCYSLICDDEFVKTQGFDVRLIQAAGRWGLSHGCDGWRCTYGMYHTYATFGGDLLRAVGWWPLPGLWHGYFDFVWQEIGNHFGLRRYCRDVKTIHLNVDRDWAGGGGAEWDETYDVARQRRQADSDVFVRWRESEWPKLSRHMKSILR